MATANTSSMRPTGGSVTNAPQCAAAKPPSAEKATSRMTSDSVVTAAAAWAEPSSGGAGTPAPPAGAAAGVRKQPAHAATPRRTRSTRQPVQPATSKAARTPGSAPGATT